MMKKPVRTYEVPQLTEFDCKVEKGFTGSGVGVSNSGRAVEGRESTGGWGLDGAKWT